MTLSNLLDSAPWVTLVIYLLFLLRLRLRRYTTVLSGRTDRFLLVLGLSGIVVFDIGPAVIPLGSLDLYGVFALLLFFLLYIQIVFYLDSSFSQRVVIYNLSESDFDTIPTIPVPEWNGAVGEPPAAEPEEGAHPTRLRRAGGALLFPPRGLTLSVEYSARSRCAVLRISGRRAPAEDWKALQKEVRACFAGRPQPPMTLRAILASAGACFATGFLIAYLHRHL